MKLVECMKHGAELIPSEWTWVFVELVARANVSKHERSNLIAHPKVGDSFT